MRELTDCIDGHAQTFAGQPKRDWIFLLECAPHTQQLYTANGSRRKGHGYTCVSCLQASQAPRSLLIGPRCGPLKAWLCRAASKNFGCESFSGSVRTR